MFVCGVEFTGNYGLGIVSGVSYDFGFGFYS